MTSFYVKDRIKQKTSDSGLRTSAKWRNLLFNKNGKSWRGYYLFDCAWNAEILMQSILLDAGCTGIETADGIMPISDYAWHMQMPVL